MDFYHYKNIVLTLILQKSSILMSISYFISLIFSTKSVFLFSFILFFIHKSYGTRSIIFSTLALTIAALTKEIFHHPRPFWIFAQVKIMGYEPHFGMISGHSIMICLFFYLSLFSKRKLILSPLSLIGVMMMMLSRIITGAHFPIQVITGALSGITLSLLLFYIEKYFMKYYNNLSFKKISVFYTISLIAILLCFYLLYFHYAKYYEIPIEWMMTAQYHLPIKIKNVSFDMIAFLCIFSINCFWSLTLESRTISFQNLKFKKIITNFLLNKHVIYFFYLRFFLLLIVYIVFILISKQIALIMMAITAPFFIFILMPFWLTKYQLIEAKHSHYSLKSIFYHSLN